MSLPLRITFEDQDYTYTLITKKIDRETSEIKINLNQEEFTIVRNTNGEWDVIERTISDEPGLLQAIAKNLALRYRLT